MKGFTPRCGRNGPHDAGGHLVYRSRRRARKQCAIGSGSGLARLACMLRPVRPAQPVADHPGQGRRPPRPGAPQDLVRYAGRPSAADSSRYAASLRGLDHLVGSMTGAGGTTSEAERTQVLALSARMPNLSGVILDDFFWLRRGTASSVAGHQQRRLPGDTDVGLPRAAGALRLG